MIQPVSAENCMRNSVNAPVLEHYTALNLLNVSSFGVKLMEILILVK